MKRVGSGQRLVAAVLAAVMLVPSFGTSWTARQPSVHSTVIDPSLSAGEVALVHTTAGHAGALSLLLRDLGATEVETLSAADTVIARVSAPALAAIKTDPRVTVATSDTAVVAMGDGTWWNSSGTTSIGSAAMNVSAAWTITRGAGVTVAVMDSGIATHPDLPLSKLVARVDFVNDGATLADPAGHGTHLGGLIAANGGMLGVAPDAQLASVRVLDANGVGKLSTVAKGFDWVLWNARRLGIKVLNLSWGAPQATSYHQDLVSAMAESAWFAGITVVAAAGNNGEVARSVTVPGADPFIITAGSFEDQGTLFVNDDRPSSFSSSGPTLDGFQKPDLLAPGHFVVSLRAPGVAFGSGIVSDLYVRMTGTSASAAFVSGVAALVRAAHPEYTPTQVKGALIAGGRKIANTSARVPDAFRSLSAMTSVNARLVPSRLLMNFITTAHAYGSGATWEGVTWEGVTWESVTWETVTWETVSWESVSWETATWEGITWESVSWERLE